MEFNSGFKGLIFTRSIRKFSANYGRLVDMFTRLATKSCLNVNESVQSITTLCS